MVYVIQNKTAPAQFVKTLPVERPGAVMKRKNFIAATSNKKRFLEIGFNGGHGTLIALYHNPLLEVYSVDICHHGYT